MFSTVLNRLKQVSIRFTLVSIFVLMTLLTAAIAIGLQYYFSKSMAKESALLFNALEASQVSNVLTRIDKDAINSTKLLSSLIPFIEPESLDDDIKPIFADVMRRYGMFNAISIGFQNGDYHGLINLSSSKNIRNQLEASYEDFWVYILVKGDDVNRQRQFFYLDKEFNLRVIRSEPSDYYTNEHLWYVNAKANANANANANEVSKSDPYLLHHLQSSGLTYSLEIPNMNAVLAVDIVLSSVSNYLQDFGNADSEIYFYRQSGELIASNQQKPEQFAIPKSTLLSFTPAQQAIISQHPVIKVSNETDWAPIDFAISGEPKGYSIDMLGLIADMTGFEFNYLNGFTWFELVERFKRKELDLLHSIYKTENTKKMGHISDPFLPVPMVLVTKKNINQIKSINELSGKKLGIPKGWSSIPIIKKYFPDINVVELASTRAVLEAVVNGEIFAGLDIWVIFNYTSKQFFIKDLMYHKSLDFGGAYFPDALHFLFSDTNKELVDIFNLALANITEEQKAVLRLKWFGSKKQRVQTDGVVPYQELIEVIKDRSQYYQLLPRTIKGVKYFIYVTELGLNNEFLTIMTTEEIVLMSSTDKVNTSIYITAICLCFIFPISWLLSAPIINPIKLFLVENEKIKNRRYNELKPVDTNIKEIKELSDSMLDMSMSIQQHEEDQKELMESFIRLIAQAIDDKSHYTAGHCNRVPELGLMLADAAEKSTLPPFKDFHFISEDEHREFRIAAWLHDCGKITTPEFIVDKGTKLEAVYNRIHEVRMRFEVLWRDAEIDYFKRISSGVESGDLCMVELTHKREQLVQDFEFIANANIGGEFMDQAHKDKLAKLATITWERNFDDRLGLSPIEELNLSKRNDAVSYPVIEPLLRDKPEHIIKRINKVEFDPKFGIKMDIPEHQYNLGELHNLLISRGTLTAEDRFKINEHVTSTIKMLENLPFPAELARVPRYASTHHETLKGTGYPRKLSAEDLSIPERILVVADIFEALTAADRPYKKAKPLSVAIDILHKMALDEHLDINVFKLFLTSGIYLKYAHKFLNSAQIDDVDVSKYLRHK